MPSTSILNDYRQFRGYSAKSPLHILVLAFAEPGFRATALFRLQSHLFKHRHTALANLVKNINHFATGADIQSGAQIGPGLVMRHPSGIVIGVGTIVGARCTILQQVTLGERRLVHEGHGEYPTVGDDVILAAGAKILGAIHIGNRSMVGANSVVLHDLPDGHIATTQPATQHPRPRRSNPSLL